MVPDSFTPFFAASAGVAGTLIGLLFVAVTLAPDRTLAPSAPAQVRETAANAFLVLANALIVSMAALIPGIDIGVATMVATVVCFVWGGVFAVNSVLARHTDRLRVRWYFRRGVALVGLTYQAWLAVRLISDPRDAEAITRLAVLMMIWFAIGLLRAWELVGGGDHHLSDAVRLWRGTRANGQRNTAPPGSD